MKKFITLVLISAGIFGFSNAANAQKIGYISADEVIQLMPEAAEVQTKLDRISEVVISKRTGSSRLRFK